MGIATYSYNRTTSGGEIIRELVNSTDGQGLHFDGVAGNIDIASPPDLGTKFSFEFIVQAEDWGTRGQYLVDFKGSGSNRFTIGRSGSSSNIGIYDTAWRTFSVAPLDDGEVHHLVVTVDGTAAIIYDNGDQVGTATLGATPTVDACTDAKIGAFSGSPTSDYLNGTVYRARFWNRTLSEAEIKDSYDNPSVKFSDQYGVEPAQNVSTCVNGSNPYTSFTSASATGFTAIQIGATASEAGTADEIALVNGKSYRVSFYIANTSQAPRVSFADSLTGTVRQEIVGLGTLTSDTHTYDITYTGATTTGVLKFDTTAAASYAISNLSITRTGVVADYDLAFAQPEISLTIQDRSTNNVTGTASASGVTQLTPIDGVNTNKLNIGGTTPKLGLGLPAANTPNHEVLIAGSNNPAIQICDTDHGISTTDGLLLQQAGVDSYIWNYEAGKMRLGTDNTTRMMIDSVGRVQVTGGTSGFDQLNISSNVTADTTKYAGVLMTNYANTTTALLGGKAEDGTTSVYYGSSGSDHRGPQNHIFYTNASSTATSGNTVRMKIDSAGAVTMPTTPAFSATPSVNQNNIAIDTATDVVFGTEIFDQASNFASNTFTAPVAGRYQLNAIVATMFIDSAADFYQISIVTSNRSYHFTYDPDFGQDATYWEFGPSILADMDANDTAVVRFYQGGGTVQTDIEKSRTYFNGFLAC